MKVTFIEASGNRRLSKVIGADETKSYPNVKNVTSHEYEIPVSLDGLRQKTDLIKTHAAKGHCMLKGHLTRKIENESRQGLTDKQALTHSLILDLDDLILDGITIPTNLDALKLTQITERFIELLPSEFHKVSYILQASASMGLKKGLNCHVEFFLKHPLGPKFLKDVLTKLNFDIEVLDKNVELAASGTALRYTLDPSVADNSKLIYIAPPQFRGITNPFSDDNQRIELVEKEEALLDLSSLYNDLTAERVSSDKDKKVRALRSQQGLPAKREKTQPIKFGDNYVNVVTNPDQVRLRPLRDDDAFIIFNLDRPGCTPGDSGAYYVYKKNPNIVYNFKGEPPFLFQEADPETYEAILTDFDVGVNEKGKPFVFRDMLSDRIFSGFYNPKDNRLIEINRTTVQSVPDFFADFGYTAPAVMPQMKLSYCPPETEGFHPKQRRVNRFIMSDYMRETQVELAITPQLETAYQQLQMLSPTIAKLLFHVLGNNEEAVMRFVNWFAFIVQYRKKAKTAWIIHGTQGTGKGQLFDKVLTPILHQSNTSGKSLKDIEDTFNAWIDSKLLVMVDEFRLSNAKNAEGLEQTIKRLITEDNTTVRAMHTDQADTVSYVNLILASNYTDVMNLEDQDRRFNVAPRQEVRINDVHPNIREEITNRLPNELPFFAEFVKQIEVNHRMVDIVWENESKQRMQISSKSTIDEFIEAFIKGDLDYFVPLLEQDPTSSELEQKIVVDGLLRNAIRYHDVQVGFRAQDLAIIYNFMNGARMTPRKFAKMCQHHNLYQTSKQVVMVNDGVEKRTKCFSTTMKLQEYSYEALASAYLAKKPVSSITMQ